MELIEENNLDRNNQMNSNAIQQHFIRSRSPSVSSEDILIWSKDETDYDSQSPSSCQSKYNPGPDTTSTQNSCRFDEMQSRNPVCWHNETFRQATDYPNGVSVNRAPFRFASPFINQDSNLMDDFIDFDLRPRTDQSENDDSDGLDYPILPRPSNPSNSCSSGMNDLNWSSGNCITESQVPPNLCTPSCSYGPKNSSYRVTKPSANQQLRSPSEQKNEKLETMKLHDPVSTCAKMTTTTTPATVPSISLSGSTICTSTTAYSVIHPPPRDPNRNHLACSRMPLSPDQKLVRNFVTNISGSVMLIPTNELAAGDSLTCTVVNILRGLHLLDHCGTEDLCASLCDLWNVGSEFPTRPSPQLMEADHETPKKPIHRSRDSLFTRSSSFTNGTTNLTVPRQTSNNCSASVGLCESTKFSRAGYLIDYLLACSYWGTSHLALRDSQSDLNSHRAVHFGSHTNDHNSCIGMDNTSSQSTLIPTYLLRPTTSTGTEWRRGRSDKLVSMLTYGQVGSKTSPALVSKLITGRFLAGPYEWKSVWPPGYEFLVNSPQLNPTQVDDSWESSKLAKWLFVWLRVGAVPVLTQLSQNVGFTDDPGQTKKSNISDPDSVHCPSELNWSYRLIYGINGRNEVYLSNPTELVPISFIIHELDKQTQIRIEKAQISNLLQHFMTRTQSCSTRYKPIPNTDSHSNVQSTAIHTFCDDLSMLAKQPNPRWASMNILGQVVSALRNLDRLTVTRRLSNLTNGLNLSPDFVTNHMHSDSNSSNMSANAASNISSSTNENFAINANNTTANSSGSSSSSGNTTSTLNRTQMAELEQFFTSPSIIIPCSQIPGINLFVDKSNQDLVCALFQLNSVRSPSP